MEGVDVVAVGGETTGGGTRSSSWIGRGSTVLGGSEGIGGEVGTTDGREDGSGAETG